MKLENVRVLDLSQFLPGPHLTMTMADHGADVILVEPKNGIGEPVRAMGTRAPDGTTVWFRNVARGKRAIACLKSRIYSAAATNAGFAVADDTMKSEMRGTISDLKRDPLNTP